MAHSEFYGEESPASYPFSEYLLSEVYLDRFRATWQHIHDPGLFDIVDDWLVNGDATETCDSYENFLIVVIDILTQWGQDKEKFYDRAYWPLVVRPGVEDLDGVDIVNVTSWCAALECPYGTRADHADLRPMEHRVFHQDRFEYYREQHRLHRLESS